MLPHFQKLHAPFKCFFLTPCSVLHLGCIYIYGEITVIFQNGSKMNLSLLISECKRGNVTAQYEFCKCYSQKLFIFCKRYVKLDVVAKEMTMNTLLKFLNELPKKEHDSVGKVMSWLQKIAINECLMHLRTRRNFFLVPLGELPDMIMEEDITAQLTVKEIFALVAKLPDGYRTVFNLYVMEEKSHAEIALLMNIDEKTSQSQLSRARKLLRQMIIQNYKDYETRQG